MKKIKYLLLLLVMSSFASCEDDGYVRIDTVSKYGEVFFGGQQIPVWVGVDVSDRKYTTYKWECDGGKFSGPTNVFRALWVAPRQKGVYTVTCTVECDGKTESRSTTMNIEEYYFDMFAISSSSNYVLANYTSTYTGGELKLIGSRADTRGNFRREFNDSELFNPFTYDIDMAWRNQYKNATSSMYWIMNFARPEKDGVKAKLYIRSLRLELWPTHTTKNYILSYEVFNSVNSQATRYTIEEGFKPEFVFTDGAKFADKKGMRPFSMSVDDNFNVRVKMDSKVAINSDAFKVWMNSNSITDKINLSNVRLESFDKCEMYLDNMYLRLE